MRRARIRAINSSRSMIGVELQIDTKPLEKAILFVAENTSKELPDIINRAGLVTIIGGKGVQGAMKLTPRAAAARINAVPVKDIAKDVMARAKRKGERLNKQDIALRIGKEYRRRIAAIGYIAVVGWNKAAIALGGHGIGRRGSSHVGWAELGGARPAIRGALECEFWNSTPVAAEIGAQALQTAIEQTSVDMIDHIQQKIADSWNQHQA